MPAAVDDSELQRHFAEFSTTASARAPLYASMSRAISLDPTMYRLLLQAPDTQRMPVLLFACVHELLIEHPEVELAQWYPNLTVAHRSPTERALIPALQTFLRSNAEPLARLLATRTVQTNEVGRCGSFLPALGLIAGEVGALGLVDVGTSGGLNLLIDRYQFHYRSDRHETLSVGGPSTVTIAVDTTGDVPVPTELPVIAARCGVDRRPIDVTDDDEAHWLEACVWPDQADRFHRLVAAIGIARQHPPEILAGDAVSSLRPAIERVGRTGHPVVMNSWVLNYLTSAARLAYLAELECLGAERDLSWVYAEAPVHIPELPNAPDPADPHRTVLSMVRWRNGERLVDHLATVHPHGYWIHWR